MEYKNTLITGITNFLICITILKIKDDCYAYEISKYITSESNSLTKRSCQSDTDRTRHSDLPSYKRWMQQIRLPSAPA